MLRRCQTIPNYQKIVNMNESIWTDTQTSTFLMIEIIKRRLVLRIVVLSVHFFSPYFGLGNEQQSYSPDSDDSDNTTLVTAL